MENNRFTRTPASASSRPVGGPYEAIVVSHLDPEYMGTLQVDLLKYTGSGNNPERTGQIFPVRYLSPFYGVTPQRFTQQNDGYQYSQQSYGFWAVPPDIGTRVLVVFAEGNAAYGYWIGCVQDQYMNFMVPDGRASTELTTEQTPNNLKGKKLPVGEYNKKIETGATSDPTRYLKPYNKDFTQVLEIQGLLEDEIRGTTTTSARREVPSSVFGINTPGPLDKRPGAPLLEYGTEQNKANQFYSRLGGSSLVFDDGDDKLVRRTHAEEGPPEYANVEAGETGGDPTIPHNELVRLRTRTGHQILLHNSEDLIYIGNSRGTAWVEITSDGKIDIYAQDSISVMTNEDLNITAERDINMEAGRNINMKATARWSDGCLIDREKSTESGRIQIESAYNFNLDIGANGKITTNSYRTGTCGPTDEGHLHINVAADTRITNGTDFYVRSARDNRLTASQFTHIKSGLDHRETATYIHMNGPVAATAAKATKAKKLSTITLPYVIPGTNGAISGYPSIVTRAPQHEPWPHHENLDPMSFKSTVTDRERPGTLGVAQRARTVDTFRKSGTPSSSGAQPAPNNSSITPTNNTSGAPDNLDPSTTGLNTQNFPAANPEIDGPVNSSNVGGVIEGLTRQQTVQWANTLGFRESTNRYGLVNEFGFAGKYQFGAAALEDIGYIRSGGSANGNSGMNSSQNWTGKNGVNSLQDWLTNTQAQESAVIELANRNLRTLRRTGGIRDGDSPDIIGGMLMGAHLLGAGGATRGRNDNEQGIQGRGTDAYGTTFEEYYALGSQSVAGDSGTTALV